MIFLIVMVVLVLTLFSLVALLDTNSLYVIGNLYVIKRDNAILGTKVVSKAFMRSISAPWYRGTGIQFRHQNKSIQIGICKRDKHHTEEDGVLDAIGGRFLDESVHNIGNW